MIGRLRALFRGPMPERMDAVPARLPPCPHAGNCVCSEEPEAPGHVPPLPAGSNPHETLARLADRLAATPRIRIRLQTAEYLHAECESRLFGFVDDLELRLDAAAGVIHVRSAARLGRHDFGVNRRRVAWLRHLLADRRRSG
ncbi:MAG: DUF1499 domain-containing protein [Gammaproteobacteria bacterium]|nr:MAG: DUF1499 domain-containing protein [Gammaproteobacteria bacterium]